jgi:hypothetical protein
MKHTYIHRAGRLVPYGTKMLPNHIVINSIKAHQIAAGGVL